jgi:hypothetical protein
VGMDEADLVSSIIRSQETDTVNKVEPEKRQRDSQRRLLEQQHESDTFEKSPKENPDDTPERETSPKTPPQTPHPPGEETDEDAEKHIDVTV